MELAAPDDGRNGLGKPWPVATGAATFKAMKFAYADPPYLGCAIKLYGKFHPEAAVYDTVKGHRDLVDRLVDEFPDGWALSAGSNNLKTILRLCPKDVRTGAWVKPFHAWVKPGQSIAYAWEPVIWRGGRKRPKSYLMIRDFVAVNICCPQIYPGQKPEEFSFWVFALLGAEPEDDFVDLFPGSGAVQKAWEQWKRIGSFEYDR